MAVQFRFGDDRIDVNVKSISDLLEVVAARLSTNQGFALATINFDHVVKLNHSKSFKAAYLAQDLIVADGNPIVWLSHLAGKPVELAPGSDLVMPLARLAAKADLPVALVGTTSRALEAAAMHMETEIPGLKIHLKIAPSLNFSATSKESDDILNKLNSSGVRLCFLALGAPKQEKLAARGRNICPMIGFASIGAGLDFLAGNQQRAPKFMRLLALEWFWRMIRSPIRLGPRYVRSFAVLPGLFVAALRLRFED